MPDIIIKVENLGKKYTIGHQRENGGYRSLRDELAQNTRGLIRKTIDLFTGKDLIQGDTQEDFWALKDVSFEIKRGEAVGIIGRNGAGKSTLLKILSRITEPTTGRVNIRGRVASLLEVGTGFHPELTGRENIYLNGAILGMARAEIKRKYDEIVAFAEVEKLLDTPVKRFSSGMYVRLAFAVAAHLEPEILVVDEVLAVGDAAFQKKCLGKMGEEAKGGRTVLFVSHNMQAIRNLCPRSILLNNGGVLIDNNTDLTMSTYSSMVRETRINSETGIGNEKYRRGSGAIRFTSIELQGKDGNRRFNFEMGETIRFRLSYKVFKELLGLAVYIGFRSGLSGETVTSIRHILSPENINAGTSGSVTLDLPDIYFRPGEYSMYIYISSAVPTETNFDVLDDLTAPLVITAGDKRQHTNFDVESPAGFFSIPSRLIANEFIEN